MSEIQYQTAKTAKEAVKFMLAAKGKGYILAGGTDLLVQMKSGVRAPGVIVMFLLAPLLESAHGRLHYCHYLRRRLRNPSRGR